MFVEDGFLKVDAKPKAGPFSLESLIAWLETMPAKRQYDFGKCKSCMLAQYFTEMGFNEVQLDNERLTHEGGEVRLPDMFNAIALDEAATFRRPGDYRWTFGAALTRARQALADR